MVFNFKRITVVCIGILCFISISFPIKAQSNGVGFASMEKFEFKNDNLWNSRLSQLAKQSFWMKYSSFKQIQRRTGIRSLKPLTIYIEEKDAPALPENNAAVGFFHDQFSTDGDVYLEGISMANDAILLVFDYVENFEISNYVKGQSDNFVITVLVYYLDSNSIGLTYIPIKKEIFSKNGVEFEEIKRKFQNAILKALEDAFVNMEGIVHSRPRRTKSSDSDNENGFKGKPDNELQNYDSDEDVEDFFG